ncbi:voltage-dependent anion channel [Lipomyces arxii]|uniref:voltage-dependent anion channel n=1 Tax=Lipomyces arxii TaxID=56418 RepID=UPI0034CD2246
MDTIKRYFLYRIENFAPAWFGMVMGLGISGSILINYPFPSFWLRGIGIAFWGLATSLFIIFFTMSVLRLILFPRSFYRVLLHPLQSVFWGCMPMGMASCLADTIGIFGDRAIWPCYVFWWINLAFSTACAWVLVLYGFIHHKRTSPAGLNAVILLPVVAMVVNSTTGSLLVKHLPEIWRPHMIVITLIVWGNGELLAFAFTCVYAWRLLTGNIPAREATISCFLPVGPLGQGAYGFLVNSINLENYLGTHSYPLLTQIPIFKYIGSAVAMIMVGFALFWLFVAVAACIIYRPRVFGAGWWGLSFPMGTFAMATFEIGQALDIEGFKVVSAIVGTSVVLVSFVLLVFTAYFSVIREDMFRGLQVEMESMFAPKVEIGAEDGKKDTCDDSIRTVV